MAKLCCVGGCIAKDVVYFRFPNSKTQCKKWIEAMNLTTKLSYNSVICSDHFKPEDYGVVRGKVRLKPKVIPILQNEQKQNETSNSNANKENSLDNQKIGNRKVKNKAEERKNSVEDVNGDVQNDTIVANNIKDAKNKKNTKHTKNTKVGKNTKDSENANRAKVAENTKNVENTKVAENVNNTKNTIDVENTNVAKNTKDAETTKVAENTSNAKNTKNTKDTSDTSSDEEPLSKHRATKDSLKNLSESITQVDLNANASTENDIEDILTYYSIKQNKKVAERQTEEIHRERNGQSIVDLSIQENEPAPVFIEVAVNEEQNRETGSPQDCLMVLESVQVELDPNELMMSDVDENGTNGEQADPISLVTSSDDDDVIIEEPHIDTVEVSDATDEDDVPLVRLLPSTARLRPRWRAPNPFYRKDVWGTYQYFCPQCNYRTPSKAEYKVHTFQHSTAVLVCNRCPFTTASKLRYTHHMRRHKDVRRYKCHLCAYKARHEMSLVYHLKCHESVGDKCLYKCDKCDYVSSVKRYLMKHVLVCSARKIKSRRHKRRTKEVR